MDLADLGCQALHRPGQTHQQVQHMDPGIYQYTAASTVWIIDPAVAPPQDLAKQYSPVTLPNLTQHLLLNELLRENVNWFTSFHETNCQRGSTRFHQVPCIAKRMSQWLFD
jgi:hypothetical protein